MKKRILTLALAIVMLLACAPAVLAANVAATVSTNPVVLDGFDLSVPMYAIGGYNYVKLRDIAKLVSDYGYNKRFEVGYENGSVSLEPGKNYTERGVELTALSAAKSIGPSTGTVYCAGEPVDLKGYAIDGFNFYQLRDVGRVLDFAVYWHIAESRVMIDTTHPFADWEKLQAESAPSQEPEKDPAEALESFGAGLASIAGSYTGYAENVYSGGYYGEIVFKAYEVPAGVMGYIVDDLDDDGEPELLLASAENSAATEHDRDTDLVPRLSVYEWDAAAKEVRLADSIIPKYESYGKPTAPAIFSDISNFNVCLGTNNGGTYIGVAACRLVYLFADGCSNVFFTLRYRNGRIENVIEPVWVCGSWIEDDELDGYARELKKGGITAKGGELFSVRIGAEMDKHVKNYRSVCLAQSISTWDQEDYFKWQSGSMDRPYPVSDIVISK